MRATHGPGWVLVRRDGDQRCHYCRAYFTHRNPPTVDHVYPKVNGTRPTHYDRRVVVAACELCNNARGAAPFVEYCHAVRWERVLAFLEDRPFRRPKFRGGAPADYARGLFARPATISTVPPWAWRLIVAHPLLSPRREPNHANR